MRNSIVAATAALIAATSLTAQATPAPTHAHEQLGTVHFATSCAPSVAPQFDRAVALLHSFEFGAAIHGFQDVLSADSTCAMAWWGIALSRWSNPMAAIIRGPAALEPGRVAAQTATRVATSPGTTDRERGYVSAVNELYSDYEHRDQATRVAAYERAMGALSLAQPADTEAMIFHAIALVGAASPSDKSYAKQLAAGAILEPLFALHPDHPGLAHYLIHAYDVPALAPRAELAAARYADIAPSAAHALHMPSHTFTRVGMWRESVNTNLRSIHAALQDSAIAEALHASDYAVYAYLQMRQDSAAHAILLGVPRLFTRFDSSAIRGAAPPATAQFASAAIPARYALERHAWREAAALPVTTASLPWAASLTHFARGLGAGRLLNGGSNSGSNGDYLRIARAAIDSLGAIHDLLTQRGDPYWAEQATIQQLGVSAWVALAEGRKDSALALMRAAASHEDATEKSAVTPGPLAPAHELLGDMLMQVGQPAAALSEYRTSLTREPNRYWSVDGARRAATAAGDHAAAKQYADQLARLIAM